jgi:cyclohexanone monooxygenase
MENINILVTGGQLEEEDLVKDGWTETPRHESSILAERGVGDISPEDLTRSMELADAIKMNEVRAAVDSIVKYKQTAEALKPWYRRHCKRPTFNNDYLPTFNRPNVTLLDTKGRGADRITEQGLVFDGVLYEVDCIIFATGFEINTAYTRRAGFEIYGRNGRTRARSPGRKARGAWEAWPKHRPPKPRRRLKTACESL